MSDKRLNASEVFRNYQVQLKKFILKRIPSKEDAEDILQNVFYQFLKMNEREDTVEQLLGWLYAVTRNQIIDSTRKKKEESLPGNEYGDGESMITDPSGKNDSPETDLLRSLAWEELEIALNELPAEQRTVFELTELEGFSFKEISETTGIPVNTLLSRKRYAVLQLRKHLRELYDDLLEEL